MSAGNSDIGPTITVRTSAKRCPSLGARRGGGRTLSHHVCVRGGLTNQQRDYRTEFRRRPGSVALDARTADALPGQTYLIILYSIGILHFWYDSFIWKLRKPVVSKAFGLEQPVRA